MYNKTQDLSKEEGFCGNYYGRETRNHWGDRECKKLQKNTSKSLRDWRKNKATKDDYLKIRNKF